MRRLSWKAMGFKSGALCCLLFLSTGCAAPFSEFQSARLAGKGKGEITASYSAISFAGEIFQNQLGLQAGFGVEDDLDIRLRYERIWVEGSAGDFLNVFGFGPKFPLHPDKGLAALYVPVGFAYGGDIETSKTWEVHPTFLATHTVSPTFDVNFSIKALLSLMTDGLYPRFAINMGFGLGPETLAYTVRPEAGVMIYTEGGSPFFHLGLGMSFSSTERKRIRLPDKK
jgi:hypothetical protein